MAEETTMTNIEIRDFATVQGVTDADYVVLSLSGGTSGKIAVDVFRSNIASGITPGIKDGVWWIGSANTGVTAEGKTPQLRKGELGVEYKYITEGDSSWRLLVPFEDLKLTFDELTDEQRDMIVLHFSDLTEEEIAELQKPANDMIAVLLKTDTDVKAAEDARVKEFAALKAESVAATADAQDTADHPTYIGADNYVYQWDKTAKSYNKTSIYVRGEAFSIRKVYPSVDAMYTDKSASFKEGDFVLINTGDVENPENAQLFVRSAGGSWDFLVDMSGAIGFTGKVPQLFIGNIVIGSGKDSAAVTLTADGTDADGNPRYRINYVIPCLAYEDLTAEQIADLQRPASDMIARLQATDDSVKAAEASRVKAENIRVSSENERISAEDTRKANENVRISAEEERKTAEEGRVSAEEDRVIDEDSRNQAEAKRAEAEIKRSDAETVRVANENIRKSNENIRQNDESVRASNENARKADETTRQNNESVRVTNENTRKTNETTRQNNETVRQSNEDIRKGNENIRVLQETARVEAEQQRVEDYAALRKDIVSATNDATDAASEARNIPKIQDGTWWVWDIAQGRYVDTGSPATSRSPQIIDGIWWVWDDASEEYISTGQSVDSDFVLSKEKIEGVFTGDIESHTHTHLIYYAQVYDETPDFSALSTWTGADGIVHDFVPGNDIYVKNASEPTGYANYKMAVSTGGNVWVRVPQVAAGWRVVMVRE